MSQAESSIKRKHQELESREQRKRHRFQPEPPRHDNRRPKNTILLQKLPPGLYEYDIFQAIAACGIPYADLRLIRDKITGASRGYAFVEFATDADALEFMNLTGGVLEVKGMQVLMRYSKKSQTVHQQGPDWFCINCGAQNLCTRPRCYKCSTPRTESEFGGLGSEEVCEYATRTILMRNLDALSTEDSVRQALIGLIPVEMEKVERVYVRKDPLTGVSLGLCYLETDRIEDALIVHRALVNLGPSLGIDGKLIIMSYCNHSIDPSKGVAKPPTTLLSSEAYFLAPNQEDTRAPPEPLPVPAPTPVETQSHQPDETIASPSTDLMEAPIVAKSGSKPEKPSKVIVHFPLSFKEKLKLACEDESGYFDFKKNVSRVCRRQLQSAEVLEKH